MKNYNLTLLGISETRWTQSGQKRLASGEMLLYSGYEEDNTAHTQGVALMLSKEAQRALIGWEAHGPRIISASFRRKKRKINMNVIQCYAPTNDSDDIDKDRFYSRLQSIVEKYPERDITIMMGDNAKIGADNTGYEDIMGRQGLGHMNENGERLADLCALNLTKTEVEEELEDGAPRAPEEFKVSLSNRFQALQDLLEVEHGTLESKWKGIQEAVTETCQEVLGPKKHQHKEWISADSLSKIKKRKEKKMAVNNSRTRAEKAKAQAGYTEANKQTKRSIKADKRKYMTWLQQQKQQQERTT
nr:hypothetical protein BaRGS_011800 [Batillaria attramentaria]